MRRLLGLMTKTEASSPQEVLPTSSGEYITQVAEGTNLVDGKQTWQHAEASRDDLEVMLKCCEAELKTMATAKVVAAPFYFERAAILLRKAKQYDREITVCEHYIQAVETYYSSVARTYEADIRKGPKFRAIAARITKSKLLRVRSQ